MLFYVLLLCASLLDAQRPPSDTLTDGHLNKVFCVTDGQCADDEICEKLCLWTHPNGWFVGCKVLCVKRSHDIPLFLVDQPAPSPNPRNAASTQRSSSATLLRSTTGAPQTTRSNLRPNDSHDNISPANPRSGVSNVNGRPFRFGSEFQLAKEEQDLTRAESGDGPFDDDDPQEVAPIELLKLFDENRVIRQDACPPPKICDVNCGIVINEAGCQDCQCVWKGVKCTTDAECKPQEYCENGGCWCKDGFRQSISQQGVCEPVEDGGASPVSPPKPSPSIDANVTVSLVEELIATTPTTSEDTNETAPSVEATIAPKPLPPTDENVTIPSVGESPATTPTALDKTPSLPTAEITIAPKPASPTVEETVVPVAGATTAASVPTEQYGVPPTANSISPSNSVTLSEITPPGGTGAPIDSLPLPHVENGSPNDLPPSVEGGAGGGEKPSGLDIGGPIDVGGVPIRDEQQFVVRSLRDLNAQKTQTKEPRNGNTSPPVRHWPGPCTDHHQCPPSLYCIFGDCWHLPNKPVRINPVVSSRQHDEKAISPPPGLRRARPYEPQIRKSSSSNLTNKRNHTTEIVPSGRRKTSSKFKKQPVSVISRRKPTKTSKKKGVGRRKFPPAIAKKAYGVATNARSAVSKTIPLKKDILKIAKKAHGVATDVRSAVSDMIPLDVVTKAPEVRRIFDPTPSTAGPSRNEQDKESEAVRLEQLSTRPVFVAIYAAKQLVRNECEDDRQCGRRYICCRKKWCDLTVECGAAKFCLPNCWATKTTYLYATTRSGQPLIDIVYD